MYFLSYCCGFFVSNGFIIFTTKAYGKTRQKRSMNCCTALYLITQVSYYFQNSCIMKWKHSYRFPTCIYVQTGLKTFPENIIPRLPQKVKPVKILFLSNLNESKGVYILLKACFLLQQKGLDFECDFVGGEGDISKEQFHKRVIEYYLNERINYIGQLYDEAKQKTFAEADIFAFPTCYETFGLVNLEAMQNQLPVVSTLEGGIPDVVENGVTGFLIPTNDAEALAEKLEILINDPDLRSKMGKAGRKKYEKEFTLDIFEQNLNNILHQVTGQQ